MSAKPALRQLTSKMGELIDGLRSGRPLITSTLSKIHAKCGNPNCRCASGRRHIAHILTRNKDGKTKTTYVPVELVPEVKLWIGEYQRLRKRLNEITVIGEKIVRGHVKAKRALRKGRSASRKPS
jgi:CRISPR type IV-associated protein Csf3